MDPRILFIFTYMLAFASCEPFNDPWLRNPMFAGIWKLTSAINLFGFNVFEDLSMKGNALICPYSIANTLGILHFGATGETENELAQVLGYREFNLTKDEAAQLSYVLATKHLPSPVPKFHQFDAPSTIIVNRKNGLLPTFKRVVEILFQAPVTVASFMDSANELIEAVNEWIAARTKNRVQRILDSVDPFADIMLVSAGYFKGVWVHKFPPRKTHSGVFYNYGLAPEEVEMMRVSNVLNYYRGEEHSVLELPFKNRNVSMIIFLPNENDRIDLLLSNFTAEFFNEQIEMLTPTNVDVILPKFKLKYQEDLDQNVRNLGFGLLFEPDSVEFPEMLKRDTVAISGIRHEVAISVSEKGIETTPPKAPANPDAFLFEEEEADFEADHPFLFVIYESRIKMVLLLGCLMEM